MSRLGKTPIPLPKGVQLTVNQNDVVVKGPKGELQQTFPKGISVVVEDSQVIVQYDEGSGLARPHHGLYRSLINNLIIGVSTGFVKELELIGVGYRAAVKGTVLDLQLGFSHPCQVAIPQGVEVDIQKSTRIKVQGADKQLIGQFAATVRAFRPPEPYKGKGVRYVGEYVRKKSGKAAKGK